MEVLGDHHQESRKQDITNEVDDQHRSVQRLGEQLEIDPRGKRRGVRVEQQPQQYPQPLTATPPRTWRTAGRNSCIPDDGVYVIRATAGISVSANPPSRVEWAWDPVTRRH